LDRACEQHAVKVLVTGAAGFIGRRLVAELANRHTVDGLVRSNDPSLPKGVQTVVCDLTRPLENVGLPPKVDVVVHLAQSRHHRDFPESSRDMFDVNVGSTQRLLEYARQAGARRFVYASSGGIYGYSADPVNEESPVDPIGYYQTTKYLGELLLKAYREFFSAVILRPFFVYGQGQARNMFLPRLAVSILEGRPIYLSGMNGIRLNPVHVSDAVRAFASAIELDGNNVVNVAGPDVMSLREIVEAMAAFLGRVTVFDRVSTASTGDLIGDITRMTAVFGPPGVRLRDRLSEVYTSAAATSAGVADG